MLPNSKYRRTGVPRGVVPCDLGEGHEHVGISGALGNVRTRILAGAVRPGEALPWKTMLADLEGIGRSRSIVIQPGLSAHAPYYEPVRLLYQRLGFDASVSAVRAHGLLSIPDDAAQLAVAVRASSARSIAAGGTGLVTVIGHSEGGPSSRYALQRLGILPQVDRLITWGGVHNGSMPMGSTLAQIADRIPGLAAVKDLSGTGQLIRGLNDDLPEFMATARREQPGFQMVSIAGDIDLPGPLRGTDGLVSLGAARLDDRIDGLHNLVLRDRAANHLSIAGTGGMHEPSIRGAALLAGGHDVSVVARSLIERGAKLSI